VTGNKYYSLSCHSRFSIRNLIKKEKIDLIHAHYGPNGIRVLSTALRTKTPLIVSFHGYDLSYELNKKEYLKALSNVIRHASALVVVSPHMIEELSRLGCPPGKIFTAYYGIDTEYFSPSVEVDKTPYIDVLHSGRIVPKKGVPDLIQSFYNVSLRCENIRLHILGDGSEYEICVRLVDELNLKSKVFFYGARPKEFVKTLMGSCDIFVLNSRRDDSGDMEGLPNAILEAMSMEKPVIATRHAGIPVVIDHDINGILIEERDNVLLAESLEKLVRSEKLRHDMGIAARNKILNFFKKERMEDDILRIVKTCLK
jgi:glycosyltransferase involved in cell wall biosynthesis